MPSLLWRSQNQICLQEFLWTRCDFRVLYLASNFSGEALTGSPIRGLSLGPIWTKGLWVISMVHTKHSWRRLHKNILTITFKKSPVMFAYSYLKIFSEDFINPSNFVQFTQIIPRIKYSRLRRRWFPAPVVDVTRWNPHQPRTKLF